MLSLQCLVSIKASYMKSKTIVLPRVCLSPVPQMSACARNWEEKLSSDAVSLV